MLRPVVTIAALIPASCALVGGIETVNYDVQDGGVTLVPEAGELDANGAVVVPPEAAADVDAAPDVWSDASPADARADPCVTGFCDSFEPTWDAPTRGWTVQRTGGGEQGAMQQNGFFLAYDQRGYWQSFLPAGAAASATIEHGLGRWNHLQLRVALKIGFVQRSTRLVIVSVGAQQYVALTTDGSSLNLVVQDTAAGALKVLAAGPQPFAVWTLYDLDIRSGSVSLTVEGRPTVTIVTAPLVDAASVILGLTSGVMAGDGKNSAAHYDALRVTVE